MVEKRKDDAALLDAAARAGEAGILIAANERVNRAVKLVKEAEVNLRSARQAERKARAQLAELEDESGNLGL